MVRLFPPSQLWDYVCGSLGSLYFVDDGDAVQVLTHFGERSGALYQLSHLPAIFYLLKVLVFVAETN